MDTTQVSISERPGALDACIKLALMAAVLLGALAISAAESHAASPPFTKQGPTLFGIGASSEAEFGEAAALSADGNTAVIGGPGDGAGVGAVWIFTRGGETWTQQGPKLTGGGESGAGAFGTSVAISSDGNTVLIGAPHDNGEIGAAWVFTRSGESWTQQGPKLTSSNEVGAARFGASVALSGAGDEALIGAPHNEGEVGATWVFAHSGETSTQQRYAPKSTRPGANFGASVSLSSDGATALVGSPGETVKKQAKYGAAYAFTRKGHGWTNREKLVGSPAELPPYHSPAKQRGRTVALSGDGGTALIAGTGSAASGVVWPFARSASPWGQQGEPIIDTETYPLGTEFGRSLALSSDGNMALVGAPFFGERKGNAWVMARSGSEWSHTETLQSDTCPTEKPCGREFGTSSALSSDGNTALIGAPLEEKVGAALVFTR